MPGTGAAGGHRSALLAATRTIEAIMVAAYAADPATYAWLGGEALRIGTEHGLCPALLGAAGDAAVAAVARCGDYAAGYRWLGRFMVLGGPAVTSRPPPSAPFVGFPRLLVEPLETASRKLSGPGKGCSPGATWPTPALATT